MSAMDNKSYETLLDEIDRCILSANVKSFVLRMVYTGEHTTQNLQILEDTFETVTKRIKSGYCDVPVNGVSILYPKHFLVMCEGSECTLVKHANLLLNSEELKPHLGVVKLLVVYHNVKKCHFKTWTTIRVNPIDKSVNLEGANTFQGQFGIFSKCLEGLKVLHGVENGSLQNLDLDSDEEINSKLLPDVATIDLVLSSDNTMHLEEYTSMYLNLPEVSYTFETSWPAPPDYTPCLEKEHISADSFVQLLTDIEDFKELEDDKIDEKSIQIDNNTNAEYATDETAFKVDSFINDEVESLRSEEVSREDATPEYDNATPEYDDDPQNHVKSNKEIFIDLEHEISNVYPEKRELFSETKFIEAFVGGILNDALSHHVRDEDNEHSTSIHNDESPVELIEDSKVIQDGGEDNADP